ncbi:MAG TPA: class I SAM-dependent methyltransferase [Acidimicrobiales bacterium]|nr:class I SAM-dependent methyltransferase [Acidimicrobiales bacterium]
MARTAHGSGQHSDHQHQGSIVLDLGWRYDLEVWLFDTFVVRGKVSEVRRQVLELARISTGSSLLDVGCGTGSLAIAAARATSGSGRVVGIDPAPRQLDRARSKARRAGLDVDFQQGVIEDLPFPDASFDVVTSTLMMHHLPAEQRQSGLAEIRRVLKPSGRLVVADFDYADDPGADDSGGHTSKAAGSSPAKNGYGGTAALPALLTESGFAIVQRAQVSFTKPHRGWSGVTVLAGQADRPTA